MKTEQEIKEMVRTKYSEIALKNGEEGCGPACGCGPSNEKIVDYTIMQDDYTSLDGYNKDADLGLGCGVPTELAEIKKGDTVLDLGSGAGNDIFVARPHAGEEGRLIGVDFSEDMVAKANKNKEKLGYTNIEFHVGEIENMPLENDTADVVISNCVLNLVPNKRNAFKEIYRVTKPGGHFTVSDIVILGEMSEKLQKSAEMYAGCVSGAIRQDEYIGIIEDTGFENVEIKRTKPIELPDELLKEYLDENEIADFRTSGPKIISITVSGYKK